MQDDVYEGYFIPKGMSYIYRAHELLVLITYLLGTLVIANVWAMNRDPTLFPDFDEFRPERFLDETGTVDVVPADTHNQGHVTFGFGRRCDFFVVFSSYKS